MSVHFITPSGAAVDRPNPVQFGGKFGKAAGTILVGATLIGSGYEVYDAYQDAKQIEAEVNPAGTPPDEKLANVGCLEHPTALNVAFSVTTPYRLLAAEKCKAPLLKGGIATGVFGGTLLTTLAAFLLSYRRKRGHHSES